jgi:predicted AAA+ superfamily ATPase
MNDPNTIDLLTRIAGALERLAPPPPPPADLNAADAFVWSAEEGRMQPVKKISRVPLSLLQGIEDAKETLLENTLRFANGEPANNALLWGSRGMGKSSLIKAVHAEVNRRQPHALALIEIHREDLPSLAKLLPQLAASERRFILFCDDLSFESKDVTYKALKTLLEGGLTGRPENVLFYASSNRKHLMPRDMIENEQSTAILPGEAVEEHVSLSDRFGLSIGFHPCDEAQFLKIIAAYAKYFELKIPKAELHARALEWQITRGARSGRVAWQFMQSLRPAC